MRPDLQSLVITEPDFGDHTGISINHIKKKKPGTELYWLFSIYFIILFVFLYVVFFGQYYQNKMFLVTLLFVVLMSTVSGLVIGKIARKEQVEKYGIQENLRGLLAEIMKYNDIIRGIDLQDQLENAGNQGIDSENRLKLVEALNVTRADLVRALKTERILRCNKDFISKNMEMFTSNLTAIQAIKINDKAGEWGKLFDQTMQVSITVQEEMRKFQYHDSSD
jgi:ABC-type multidrug transport system fused ATPase/permease subunit